MDIAHYKAMERLGIEIVQALDNEDGDDSFRFHVVSNVKIVVYSRKRGSKLVEFCFQNPSLSFRVNEGKWRTYSPWLNFEDYLWNEKDQEYEQVRNEIMKAVKARFQELSQPQGQESSQTQGNKLRDIMTK